MSAKSISSLVAIVVAATVGCATTVSEREVRDTSSRDALVRDGKGTELALERDPEKRSERAPRVRASTERGSSEDRVTASSRMSDQPEEGPRVPTPSSCNFRC